MSTRYPASVERARNRADKDWAWVFFNMDQAERDAVDKWLVETKHPLAYASGSQEMRFRRLVQEEPHSHTPVSKGNEHTCLDCKVLPPFSVVLCPLHAAAPRMLELIENLATGWAYDEETKGWDAVLVKRYRDDARAILRDVEGESNE